MDEFSWAFGSSASLALRMGQAAFSISSLLVMCTALEFLHYTAFCFLVTVTGLVIPWSLTLSVVDAFSVFFKRLSLRVGVVSSIFITDWALSFLLLASACSTLGVTSFLMVFGASICNAKLCLRFQLSATLAFLSWSLLLASSLFNLRFLISLLSSFIHA